MTPKYVGQIIRDYLILDKIENGKYSAKCVHCGLERTYLYQAILKGSKKEGNALVCTCTLSGIKVGDKFGRLTVLSREIESKEYGRVSWKCKCDCGKEIVVAGHSLKSGNTRSCGCLSLERKINTIKEYNKNLDNLVGEKSGLLTVIRQATTEEVANKPKGIRYWVCRCECGNEHIVSTSDFRLNKVQSCGCLNSKGEAKISSILAENGINFAKQYHFNDLIGKGGRHYSFDFGVIDEEGNLKYIIEYDGQQHFSSSYQFGENKEEAFSKIAERDKIKNEYCFSNNIPLIRIPYTHLKKITIDDLKLETTTFLLEGDGDK